MQTRQWTNGSLPQTLQIGVIMLYFWGVSILIFGLDSQFVIFPQQSAIRVILAAAYVVAGFLIANERKIGWSLGVVVTALPLAARLLWAFGVNLGPQPDIFVVGALSPAHRPWDYDPLGLLFEVAIFALLVHPQSRDYKRIWFK